jgi:hypothetical protein
MTGHLCRSPCAAATLTRHCYHRQVPDPNFWRLDALGLGFTLCSGFCLMHSDWWLLDSDERR